MTEFKYQVAMSCGGCSGAVTRALKNKVNEEKFDVSLETQLVTITDYPELLKDEIAKEEVKPEDVEKFKYNRLLEIIKKTGKKVTEIKQEEVLAAAAA
ncbi:hypothetical protein LPJ78_000698 [Coemansia sp. RSA 989]|nr:hypothetical protein LPJ68_000326 [Coemansia sp. RSA 1086]KAJ1752651.1 hypothetical protein LPJ79_001037 [Coemansia sp. RSA 1821]KAJ1867826.1 hypothetical protein LPJ78_000698 [Coemansia sp. RSA 989]KAJ1874685.1 hypothetical protein LPJ55_001292 [Coemansia sp. RSA 990]KAJ2673708.1 hypothetical protein IWW42_002120 [Coemansia sp. RSA 1085]